MTCYSKDYHARHLESIVVDSVCLLFHDLKISDSIMTIYIKTMNEDDDKEVVAQACVSVADIIKDFGYVAVEPCKDIGGFVYR